MPDGEGRWEEEKNMGKGKPKVARWRGVELLAPKATEWGIHKGGDEVPGTRIS